MIRAKSSIEDLSFVASRDGVQLPKYTEGQLPRCFWSVPTRGSYSAECDLGAELALEYLAFEENNPSCPILNLIVTDMPSPLTGVEVGFLIMVGFAASAGADYARRVRAHQTSAAA